jgi:hypothetical protein
MSEVYANGNAIACKAGGGKVIAAFPDVCLSPPSPPAGPIPVPYPDTSFSKDMKNGSKTVKIASKEVMLKDKSFYKSSPLGDEAATRSFGANVVTHVITGKTYFGAWSMDVKFEGENVPRHIDLTTSNHASYPGGSGPMTNAEKMALKRVEKGKCPCCGKPDHGTSGTAMNMEEWYITNKPAGKTDQDVKDLVKKAKDRPGCTCDKTGKKSTLLPSPPCDVFFAKPSHTGALWDDDTKARFQRTHKAPTGAALDTQAQQMFAAKTNPRSLAHQRQLQRQTNHLTPKNAGGCSSDQNLQANWDLCAACQVIDEEFNIYQL